MLKTTINGKNKKQQKKIKRRLMMDITKIDFKPIIEKAKQSEQGLSELLSIIQPYVINKSRSYLKSIEDAQDIYQIICIRLYNNLDTISPDHFMSYLKTSVTNACIDELRKRHKVNDDEEEIKTFSIDAFEDFDIPDENNGIDLLDEYRNKVVFEVLDKLPSKQKEVILLRYVDDMKIKDIAEKLEVNENTVKSRMYAAFENIKEEILRIQDRDDIKLYSYSPVLFFLLLLRGNSDTSLPIDYQLINRTMNSINNQATNTIVDETIHNASKQAASKIASSETIKTATGAFASKVGASAASKALIGILVAGTITAGGFMVYSNIKNQQMAELYNSDSITLNIDYDDSTPFVIGDTRQLNYELASQNNLDYEILVNNQTQDIASLQDNTITALKIGDAKIEFTLKNKYTDKVEHETLEFTVVPPDNQLNYIGNLMKEAGYTQRTLFYPMTAEMVGNSYEGFDWSLLDMTAEEYLNIKVYDPKTGEEATGSKQWGLDYNAAAVDKYGMLTYLVYPDILWNGGSLFYNYEIIDNDYKKVRLKTSGGNTESVLDLTYNEQYDKYEYVSKNGETHYVDFKSVVIPTSYTEGFYEWTGAINDIKVYYDDNKNITKITNISYPNNFIEHNLIYDDENRVTKIISDLPGVVHEIEIIYDDHGLLKNIVVGGYVPYTGKRYVSQIINYSYS